MLITHLGCSICENLKLGKTRDGVAILLANNLVVAALAAIRQLLEHCEPAHSPCLLCRLAERRS